MKDATNFTYADLEAMPIWQVVSVKDDRDVVVHKDCLTSKQADNLQVRFAMQDTYFDYEACQMPLHDHHIWQWEVRESAKRIIAQIEEMK